MRRLHWSATVLATLVLSTSLSQVHAQGYESGEDGDQGGRVRLTAEAQPADPVPFDPDLAADDPPPPGYDPYGLYAPGPYGPPAYNSPIAAQAGPPGANPWPTMSPFMEHQFRQRKNDGGIWFDEHNDRGLIYHYSMGYLLGEFKKPSNALVGTQRPGVTLFSPAQPQLFRQLHLNEVFRSDGDSNGIEARWGFTKPDDTAFEMRGWYQFETLYNLSKGTNQGDINNTNLLRPSYGIGWYTGVGTGGTVTPYDKLFKLQYTTQAGGVTADFLNTPWWKTNSMKLRPMWGMRYMYIGERFTFHGSESGLVYVVNASGNVVPGTAGNSPNNFGPYEASFDSKVDSHLAGPDIGLQYDVGGDSFKIWGQSRFALLGNFERLQLEGRNLGDGFSTTNFNTNPTSFKSVTRNAHVSPLLEQSFFMEAPIFKLIPYVNRWNVMETAKFRLGYTYTWVAEVSRPESNIVYNGAPLQPELRNERSTWRMSNFSFAVDWTY